MSTPWRTARLLSLQTARNNLLAISDDLKAAIATVSAQIDAELASHLAASSQVTATSDANAAALVDALAAVQALSSKLPPLVVPAPPAA